MKKEKALMNSVTTCKRILEEWQFRRIIGERSKGYDHDYHKNYPQILSPRWQGSSCKNLIAGQLSNNSGQNKDRNVKGENVIGKGRISVKEHCDCNRDEKNADCFGKNEVLACPLDKAVLYESEYQRWPEP